MDIKKDLLTESINKLLNQNILNEAEEDENSGDNNELDTDDNTEEDSSDDNSEELPEDDSSNDDSDSDDNTDNTDNSDTDDSDDSDSDADDSGEELPEEEPKEPAENKSDKFLKLQIFNKLIELKNVMDKFDYIINDRNMENFTDSERKDMFDVTQLTTNSLDELKDNINLFNNKFINNVEVDKAEKIYKKFEKAYTDIFDNYLKSYNKLESAKKRGKDKK